MKMKMQLADILIGIKTILLANLVQYGLVINIIRFLLRKVICLYAIRFFTLISEQYK